VGTSIYIDRSTGNNADQLDALLEAPRRAAPSLRFGRDDEHEARRQAKERRQLERRRARDARVQVQTAGALAELGALLDRAPALSRKPARRLPPSRESEATTPSAAGSHDARQNAGAHATGSPATAVRHPRDPAPVDAKQDAEAIGQPEARATTDLSEPTSERRRPRGRRGGQRNRQQHPADSYEEVLAQATVGAMVRALIAESGDPDPRIATRQAEAAAAKELLPSLAAIREQPWMAAAFAALETNRRDALREAARKAAKTVVAATNGTEDPQAAQAVLLALCFMQRYAISAIRAARETGLVSDTRAEALETIRAEVRQQAGVLIDAGEARAVHQAFRQIAHPDASPWHSHREQLAQAIGERAVTEVGTAARHGRNQAERDAAGISGRDVNAEVARRVAVAFAVLTARPRLAVCNPQTERNGQAGQPVRRTRQR